MVRADVSMCMIAVPVSFCYRHTCIFVHIYRPATNMPLYSAQLNVVCSIRVDSILNICQLIMGAVYLH